MTESASEFWVGPEIEPTISPGDDLAIQSQKRQVMAGRMESALAAASALRSNNSDRRKADLAEINQLAPLWREIGWQETLKLREKAGLSVVDEALVLTPQELPVLAGLLEVGGWRASNTSRWFWQERYEQAMTILNAKICSVPGVFDLPVNLNLQGFTDGKLPFSLDDFTIWRVVAEKDTWLAWLSLGFTEKTVMDYGLNTNSWPALALVTGQIHGLTGLERNGLNHLRMSYSLARSQPDEKGDDFTRSQEVLSLLVTEVVKSLVVDFNAPEAARVIERRKGARPELGSSPSPEKEYFALQPIRPSAVFVQGYTRSGWGPSQGQEITCESYWKGAEYFFLWYLLHHPNKVNELLAVDLGNGEFAEAEAVAFANRIIPLDLAISVGNDGTKVRQLIIRLLLNDSSFSRKDIDQIKQWFVKLGETPAALERIRQGTLGNRKLTQQRHPGLFASPNLVFQAEARAISVLNMALGSDLCETDKRARTDFLAGFREKVITEGFGVIAEELGWL